METYILEKDDYTRKQILFIIDVQNHFKEYLTDNYIKELQKYSKGFDKVYQIWDNHVRGEVSDYTYATNPQPLIPNNVDTYSMYNNIDLIEKRYYYLKDLNISDFFEERVDAETLEYLTKTKNFEKGDFFKTKENTTVVYVDNNHVWFEIPIKLERIIKDLKQVNSSITLVGGSEGECLLDITNAFDYLNTDYILNHDYIYSAKYCPK